MPAYSKAVSIEDRFSPLGSVSKIPYQKFDESGHQIIIENGTCWILEL
ncbi:MAG: hypothetical protein WC122_00730 [archaeon]